MYLLIKRGRMKIKSQAALEFLTTYAWAFIVIAVTISALYYFGIFDFSKYLPQKCIFPSQLKCIDFSLLPSEVRLKLVNNLGEDIQIQSISITNDATVPISCTVNITPIGWIHATQKDFTFKACSGGAYLPDERVELKVSMDYFAVNTPSHPIHKINGKINGKVTT